MRRFARVAVKALVVVSLLLCVAAGGLWVRTYFVSDELSHYRALSSNGAEGDPTVSTSFHASAHHFMTARGEVGVMIAEEFWPAEEGSAWFHRSVPAQGVPLSPRIGRYGFYLEGWRERPPGGAAPAWIVDVDGISAPSASANTQPALVLPFLNSVQPRYIFVPLWFVMAVLAVPPIGAWVGGWRGRRARRRRKAGLCGRCGYDMRGTPQRCPECGELA